MPTTDLTNSNAWGSVTLAQDEIWQARGGRILTTVEPIARDDQGIELGTNMVRTFKSGQTVRFRPLIPNGVTVDIILAREAL